MNQQKSVISLLCPSNWSVPGCKSVVWEPHHLQMFMIWSLQFHCLLLWLLSLSYLVISLLPCILEKCNHSLVLYSLSSFYSLLIFLVDIHLDCPHLPLGFSHCLWWCLQPWPRSRAPNFQQPPSTLPWMSRKHLTFSMFKIRFALTCAMAWMTLKHLALRDRNQSQNTTYFTIPSIGNVQEKTSHQGGWGRGVKSNAGCVCLTMKNMVWGFWGGGWEKYSKIDYGDWWLHNSEYTKRTVELYTLNGWTVWYVDYISVMLLKIK